jgi:hypothetical protein
VLDRARSAARSRGLVTGADVPAELVSPPIA